MGSKAALDARDLSNVLVTYCRLLGRYREHLNLLNVYPVPDADTGANMCSTIGGVVEALSATGDDMAEVCRAIRRGAMLGARGASGVIMSRLLGALVESFDGSPLVDGPAMAAGLVEARDSAYRAVLRPVEGTILTVIREAAEAAEAASSTGSLVDVLETAGGAAAAAVERTPELLPALREAGVVDAGGLGLRLFFDALLHVADHRHLPEAPTAGPAETPVPEHMPRFEVVVRLHAPGESMGDFRTVWDRLGNDSTVVAEDQGEWVCHIHTNHPEAALEAARAAGELYDVSVTDLVEQIMRLRSGRADRVGVLSVSLGAGLEERWLEMGATAVMAGGVSQNPSTAELLQAVEATGAATVIILPNDENVIAVAELVAGLTDKEVMVVPSSSIPAGIAALRRFDPTVPDGAVEAMRAAAGSISAGGISRALREADSPLGRIRAGTWMVRMADGSLSTAETLREAVLHLLGRLTAGSAPARVEIIVGEGSDPAVTDEARRHVSSRWPEASLTVVDGGQPYYPYLIGVEPAGGSVDSTG